MDAIQYELLQEKAFNLARMAARLERALEALQAFDRTHPDASAPSDEHAGQRLDLVATAGEALWYLVVQREVCGLHDSDEIIRHFQVPRDVQLRMGPRRSSDGAKVPSAKCQVPSAK
jgi:hypothetical protein